MPPRSEKATAGSGTKKKVVKPSPKISPEASKIVEAVDKVEEVSISAAVAVEPTKEEVKATEVDEAKAEEKPSVPALLLEPESRGCRSSITGIDDLSTIMARNFGIQQIGKSVPMSAVKPSATAAANPNPSSGQFSDRKAGALAIPSSGTIPSPVTKKTNLTAENDVGLTAFDVTKSSVRKITPPPAIRRLAATGKPARPAPVARARDAAEAEERTHQ